jgi:hypothetical protein
MAGFSGMPRDILRSWAGVARSGFEGLAWSCRSPSFVLVLARNGNEALLLVLLKLGSVEGAREWRTRRCTGAGMTSVRVVGSFSKVK